MLLKQYLHYNSDVTYLNGEATVASATPLVHVGAGHFSDSPTLLDKR